jgi:hypothetical protein
VIRRRLTILEQRDRLSLGQEAIILVVAADEGWREQSAEHLAAVDALDVRHGGISTGYSCLSPSGSQPRESGRQLPPEPKTLARTGIMASTQSTSESGT